MILMGRINPVRLLLNGSTRPNAQAGRPGAATGDAVGGVAVGVHVEETRGFILGARRRHGVGGVRR